MNTSPNSETITRETAAPHGFNPDWRARKSAAFDLELNSTGHGTIPLMLWGKTHDVYRNANLSIYSAQTCNARCPFCVEELRPASRGTELSMQKAIETETHRYYQRLEAVLSAVRPLNPSVSITGGEPSLDPRLPTILAVMKQHQLRKQTMTTNGSGLLRRVQNLRVLDSILSSQLSHLNISVAHPDPAENARLMQLPDALSLEELRTIVREVRAAGIRTRLSCVLLRESCANLAQMRAYLSFAHHLGVDNVIFRQLMQVDAEKVQENHVTRYSDKQRVELEPLLNALMEQPDFAFQSQVMGYYYYVEVWRYTGQESPLDVVFEEADLAQLERYKRAYPDRINELIFHPNAMLASTWQPWDGILGPPSTADNADLPPYASPHPSELPHGLKTVDV